MSHELYFESGWSNKDAVLKRSGEIHCHKKARASPPAVTQRRLTRQTLPLHLPRVNPLRSSSLFSIFRHLFPGSAPPSLDLPSSCSLSLSPLFSLFSNWDDKISDCHSYSCLLLIDKTISNPSWAPYASNAPLVQSCGVSTERGSISRFELWTTTSAFISELLSEEMEAERGRRLPRPPGVPPHSRVRRQTFTPSRRTARSSWL